MSVAAGLPIIAKAAPSAAAGAGGLVLAGVAFMATLLIHELAHGLVLKVLFGSRVRVGFAVGRWQPAGGGVTMIGGLTLPDFRERPPVSRWDHARRAVAILAGPTVDIAALVTALTVALRAPQTSLLTVACYWTTALIFLTELASLKAEGDYSLARDAIRDARA